MNALTPRLSEILEAVIESYVATGRPVGSRHLFDSCDFGLAPSTLRSELSRLEQLGYLDHPHTSAGRVPTDKGYRFYVDARAQENRRAGGQEAEIAGAELEDTLRRAAAVLAGATGLLAMVSAPLRDDSAIRHVEVLQLHREMIMVVIITGSGGIAKKIIVFDKPVDSGLVYWARVFFGEVVCGLDLGSRRLRLRLEEQELSEAERAFIDALAPAFGALPVGGAGLYLDGASRFFSRLEEDGARQTRRLMEMLDRQEEVLGLLSEALDERSVYLRIGRELPRAAMQNCSFVAAGYGLARRSLGVVGVLGPTRMDYPAVIGSVRYAADRLSRVVEEIYQ